MQYVRNTFGIALLFCLWGVAALGIAPAMERQLQGDAEQLLDALETKVEVEADGLNVRISGEVATMEERYTIFAQLRPMHPLARIRGNVTIAAEPRFQRTIERGAINLNARSTAQPDSRGDNGGTAVPQMRFEVEGQETVIDIGLGSCADMRLLDPNVVCTGSN